MNLLSKISLVMAAAMLSASFSPAQTQDPENGTVSSKKYAVVNFSVNFMREQPEYEAELGDQALMGTVVEIVGKKDYWKQIVSPEPYKAWVNDMGLVEMDGDQLDQYIAAPKYICTAEYSHVFARPNRNAERLSDMVMGDIVRIWYRSNGEGSNIKQTKKNQEMFLGVILPSGRKGYVPKEDLEVFSEWAQTRNATVGNIIVTAKLFLGVPYMWGGTSIKAVDCSGLARSVWFMNGILLPRNASQQAKVGDDIDFHPDYSISETSDEFKTEMKKRISYLKPGDLLFFGKRATADSKEKVSHVAIYLGGGKYIHSSQIVRISSLIPGDPDFSRTFIRARRVLGNEDAGKGIVSILKSPSYFKQ